MTVGALAIASGLAFMTEGVDLDWSRSIVGSLVVVDIVEVVVVEVVGSLVKHAGGTVGFVIPDLDSTTLHFDGALAHINSEQGL